MTKHKTAAEHIALAESILEQVEANPYYEAPGDELECASLHIKLAKVILRAQESPEKPKPGTVRGYA